MAYAGGFQPQLPPPPMAFANPPALVAPGAPLALSADQRRLPGSVRTAGVLMIVFGGFYMAIVTISILAGEGSSALWINILSYVVAAISVAVPILMLMRKRWAYSMSVSILIATVLLFALEVISSGLWFQVRALPVVVLLIVVFTLIYGVPLMLLMGKSARRAFEGERSPSAVVWAGGGWEYPGTEPFAYHPSEMPASLLWMRAMSPYSGLPVYGAGAGFPMAPPYPPAYGAGATYAPPGATAGPTPYAGPAPYSSNQWSPSGLNPGGMQYSS